MRAKELGLFKENAVIMADNVLKPGAPLFLHHVVKAYETQLLSVPEFGLGHQQLHDWVAISHWKGAPKRRPEAPEGFKRLAASCDEFRRRSLSGRLSAEERSSSLQLKSHYIL